MESRDGVVVADVGDPHVPGTGRRQRLDVLGAVGPEGDADGLAGRGVDGEDAAGVAGVVDRVGAVALDHQPAGLDDLGVLEAEDLLAVAVHAGGREADDERGEHGDGAEAAEEPLSHRSMPTSTASFGVTPQAGDELVVVARPIGESASPGAGRAQHRVARRVRALDELHDVDAIAERAAGSRRAAHRSGCRRSARAGFPCRVSRAYGAGVVAVRSWAAMSWWQHGAASTRPAPHSTARANASSVAVSQACRASTTSGGSRQGRVADGADHEVGIDAERGGDAGVVVGRLLLDVDAGDPHRQVCARR